MFIDSHQAIDLPYDTARARLASLVDGGGVRRASDAAYAHGLDALMRVGPFGDGLVVSKLVAVRFLEPVERDSVTTVGLRWEATGPAAGLFPVLDADLTLTPGGGHRAQLALTGTYRAPFGRLGAALDRALLHRVATNDRGRPAHRTGRRHRQPRHRGSAPPADSARSARVSTLCHPGYWGHH